MSTRRSCAHAAAVTVALGVGWVAAAAATLVLALAVLLLSVYGLVGTFFGAVGGLVVGLARLPSRWHALVRYGAALACSAAGAALGCSITVGVYALLQAD